MPSQRPSNITIVLIVAVLAVFAIVSTKQTLARFSQARIALKSGPSGVAAPDIGLGFEELGSGIHDILS